MPHLEAPASAGHIHDVFAEYEKTFGVDSLTRKSGQRKERSSSSHGASPVRDESLLLNPNDGSVHVEHGPQHPDCTMISIPTKAGSGGLYYANHVTGIGHDCSWPRSQMEEQQQQQEPTRNTATPLNPPLRKRPGLPVGSHAPSSPKRPRGSSRGRHGRRRRRGRRKHQSARIRYNMYCRDKEWDVGDLRISVEEDGTLSCELPWAPTTVSVSSLKGTLLERAEELVKRDAGKDRPMVPRQRGERFEEEVISALRYFDLYINPLAAPSFYATAKIDQFLFDLNDSMDFGFVIYPGPSLIGTYGLLNARGIFRFRIFRSIYEETTCNSRRLSSPRLLFLFLFAIRASKMQKIKFAA